MIASEFYTESVGGTELRRGWHTFTWHSSRKSVSRFDAFYHAASAARSKDNGEPDLCLHYHANYYIASVLDTDGRNIEAG